MQTKPSSRTTSYQQVLKMAHKWQLEISVTSFAKRKQAKNLKAVSIRAQANLALIQLKSLDQGLKRYQPQAISTCLHYLPQAWEVCFAHIARVTGSAHQRPRTKPRLYLAHILVQVPKGAQAPMKSPQQKQLSANMRTDYPGYNLQTACVLSVSKNKPEARREKQRKEEREGGNQKLGIRNKVGVKGEMKLESLLYLSSWKSSMQGQFLTLSPLCNRLSHSIFQYSEVPRLSKRFC